jgi:hypothetical protein
MGKLMMSMPAVEGWLGAAVGALALATGASGGGVVAAMGPSQIIVMKINGKASIIPATREALPGATGRSSSAVHRLRSARLAGGSGQGRRHLAFGTVSSSSSISSRPRPNSMRVFWATPSLTWRSDM